MPETRWWVKEEVAGEKVEEKNVGGEGTGVGRTKEQREERLRDLQWLHLGFLFFFSGEWPLIECLSRREAWSGRRAPC